VALLRDDGTPGESGAVEVSVPAHGHDVTGVEAAIGRFADASYAYRFGPPPHVGVRAVLSIEGTEREAVWKVPLASLR
jgi:hypothetical protein